MRNENASRFLSRIPSWLVGLVSGVLYSGIAVAAVAAVRPKYFHIDDALNADLPTSAGLLRVLESGALPILNPWAMSGGNHLVTMARAPFHPVALLMAGAWNVTGANGVTLITVFLHLLLIFTGVFLLAKSGLGLNLRWSLIASLLVASQPMLFGVLLTSWWAVSLGVGAFAWSAGALMWAARDPRPTRLLLLGVTTVGLFTAGWPHSWLVFAITCVLVAGYTTAVSDARGIGRLSSATLLAGAVITGTLVSLPFLSEYIALAAGGFLRRTSEFDNAGNFLNPSVSQVLSFGNPASGDFFNTFWGYIWIPVPIGFVTLLVWVAIFFCRHDRAMWKQDRLLQLLLALTAVLSLCTQMPSQLGPTRYGFRYLPYSTMFLALACVYYLARNERVWTRGRMWAASSVIAVSALFSSWKVPSQTDFLYTLVTPGLFAVGTILVLLLYRRVSVRPALEWALVVLAAVVVVLQIPAYGGFFRNDDTIPASGTADRVRAVSAGGFLLDAVSGLHRNQWAPGMESARYEIFDISLVNSYDSVGHAAFFNLLPQIGTQNYQKPAAVARLSRPAPAPFGSSCLFDVMRVTAVFTDANPKVGEHAALARCGFRLHSVREDTAMFAHVRPASDPESTVSLATEGTMIASDQLVNAQVERVEVSNPTGSDGRVAFARVWWPGYRATIDGRPVPVQSLDGLFVSVVVPAGATGTLELSYYPSTWNWAVPVGVTGMLLLAALSIYARRLGRKGQGVIEDGAGRHTIGEPAPGRE